MIFDTIVDRVTRLAQEAAERERAAAAARKQRELEAGLRALASKGFRSAEDVYASPEYRTSQGWASSGSIERVRDTGPAVRRDNAYAEGWAGSGEIERIRDVGLDTYLYDLRRDRLTEPQRFESDSGAFTYGASRGAQMFAGGLPQTAFEDFRGAAELRDVLDPYVAEPYGGPDILDLAGSAFSYEIPYVTDFARERLRKPVQRGVEAGLDIAYGMTPAAQSQVTPSGTRAEAERAAAAGGSLAGALVPTTAGEIGLELIPGVGLAPDAARLFRSAAKSAGRSVSGFARSPEGKALLKRLVGEAGGPGLTPEELLRRTAGDDAAKALDDLPEWGDDYFYTTPAPSEDDVLLPAGGRARIEARIQELETLIEAEPLSAQTGHIRRVNRPRQTGMRQGRRGKATMQVVEQARVDDAVYAQLKRRAEEKNQPFHAERVKGGVGWWVDIEDELPGAARYIDEADPDAGSTLDRIRTVKELQKELSAVRRQLKTAAEEPTLREAAEHLRDVNHVLIARLDEDPTLSDVVERYAEAYEEARAAIVAGSDEVPESVRELVPGFAPRDTLASDAAGEATEAAAAADDAGVPAVVEGRAGASGAAAEERPPSDRGAAQGSLGGDEPPPPRGPADAGPSRPSENFPDLVQRYTVEQRELFDRINIEAAQQGRVKGFGSVQRALDEASAPGAKIIAKAKAATRRLLSPYYYITNANALVDEDLAVQRLAHARRRAVGAMDAQMIAIALGEKGESIGALRSKADWRAAYHGPAAKTKEQAELVGYIGDVIERPQFYRMSEQQRDFFRANQRFLLSRLRYAKSQGVDIQEFQGEFVTHVYQQPKRAARRSGGGLGSKTGTQKTRTISDYWTAAGRTREEDRLLPEFVPGVTENQRGIFETLTQVHQAQLQKSIADAELIAQLKASNLRSTAPKRGFRQTSVPGLAGSYFPDDVASRIDDVFSTQRGQFEQIALLPADLAKTMIASLDATPLVGLQGVRRIMDNPVPTTLLDIPKAMQLVASDDAWRAWMQKNAELLRQATADGVNLFQDFKVATESSSGSLLYKIPGLGRKLESAESRMWGRGAAMYKALSYSEAKAQTEFMQRLPEAASASVRRRLRRGETPGQIAAQHANNVYGGLEAALRGQGAGYMALERFFLFAPDWLRANVGLLATAGVRPWTRQGAVAARFVAGSLAVGALAAELGTRIATSGREGANLTDPGRGDWMAMRTPAGTLTIMGPLRSYYRTLFNVATAARKGEWERALGDGEYFGRTRLGPVPANIWTQMRNEDPLGRPVTTARPNSLQDLQQRATAVLKGSLPISAQQGMEAISKGGASAPAIVAISLLGFTVTPDRIATQLNRAAQAEYGRSYSELSPGEKAELQDREDVQRALQESKDETAAKADAGDPVAIVRMFEAAATEKYQATLAEIEDLPPSEWRVRYKEARADRLAALDVLRRTDARPVQEFFEQLESREPKTPRLAILGEYFDIFERFKDPVTGRIDAEKTDAMNEALDAYEASLTRKQQEELLADLGAKDTPQQTAYREAVGYIADSGYFDIRDVGWSAPNVRAMFEGAGMTAVDDYASVEEFRSAFVDHWMQEKPPGITEESARRTLERKFDAIPAVKEYERLVGVERLKKFRDDPYLLLLATRWGYNTLSEDEQKILDAASELLAGR